MEEGEIEQGGETVGQRWREVDTLGKGMLPEGISSIVNHTPKIYFRWLPKWLPYWVVAGRRVEEKLQRMTLEDKSELVAELTDQWLCRAGLWGDTIGHTILIWQQGEAVFCVPRNELTSSCCSPSSSLQSRVNRDRKSENTHWEWEGGRSPHLLKAVHCRTGQSRQGDMKMCFSPSPHRWKFQPQDKHMAQEGSHGSSKLKRAHLKPPG